MSENNDIAAPNHAENAAGGAAPIRVLMIDDQAIIGEAIRHMLAGQDDIEFFFCDKPTEALHAAESFRPTVILQDLVMPDVDGLTLVKFFRANPATREIPLVVLSSKEEPDIKYRAFDSGANDYMVKFPDKLEVLARIRYHSKAYTTLCERNEAMQKLQKSQEALKKELEEADKYVKSLLPERIDTPEISTDWVFKSSTELGGDCFGYGWIDRDNFAIYLLDVCGHGVGAALLSVSAMNALRSQNLSGVNFRKPEEVLYALNNTFDMEKQNQMYFTLWYGVYNQKTRKLSYASGGHPPALMIENGKCEKLWTGGMIIGGMPGTRFPASQADVPSGAKLYVFSDGVYEVDYANGRGMMSFDDFAAAIAKAPENGKRKVVSMMEFSSEAQNSDSFEDDFSLCEIVFK